MRPLAYRVVVMDPWGIILEDRPGFRSHALLLKNDEVAYLEDDQSVAGILSQQRTKVTDVHDCLELVCCFADIQGYRLQPYDPSLEAIDQNPKFGGSVEARKVDWKLTIARSVSRWTIECVLLVDPRRERCFRYSISVDRDGNISAQRGALVYVGLVTY